MGYIIDVLRDLADWTESFADTDWALGFLCFIAFSESLFFPIPPDPLLIAMGVSQPGSAIWLSLLVTICSVLGGIFGHIVGNKIGRPVLYRLISRRQITLAERLFKKYGFWAILLAALTPIPYKVFTILAGIMNMDIRPFILVSLLGRAIRFLTVGVLIFVFGDSIKSFIDHNFEILTIALATVLLAVMSGYFAYNHLRKNRRTIHQ